MTAPLHSTRRFTPLGTVAPPLVMVTILLAGAINPASSQEPVLRRGGFSPPADASLQDASLRDDGWRYTKLGWQKTSSWNVSPPSRQALDASAWPHLAGPTSWHPAMMAIWMLAISLIALRLFPFQAAPVEKEQPQTLENSWQHVLQRVISGSRSVKVDPICGRSLF